MANLTIGIGDFKICKKPDVLVTYALGSCVGICIIDEQTGIAGLSHIMLPDSSTAVSGNATPMRFADTAIPMMVKQMESMGASKMRLRSKIAGGATMFAVANDKFNIGERNIAAVKKTLMDLRIPIIAEDTGANYGRTVFFYPDSGTMEVRSTIKGNVRL